MTASVLRSYSDGVGSEVPLQAFALNCCVPETLSEVVLGAVSTSMASEATDRNHKFAVLLVVGENLLKAVAQVVEVFVLRHLRLKHARLNRRGHGAREGVVKALTAASSTTLGEEVVGCGTVCHHIKRGRLASHASLGSSSWRVRS